MTRTRYLLSDMGRRLDWPTLFSFIRYLPPNSALNDDAETRWWFSGVYDAELLANIVDLLAAYVTQGRAKPQKRPTTKQKLTGERHYGRDPIPIADFDDWYYSGE